MPMLCGIAILGGPLIMPQKQIGLGVTSVSSPAGGRGSIRQTAIPGVHVLNDSSDAKRRVKYNPRSTR
jgi:hypothetical protein